MTAQSAGTGNVESETASESSDKGATKPNSFAAALIADAASMGHSIGDPKVLESAKSEETEEKEETTNQEHTEETTDETTEQTGEEIAGEQTEESEESEEESEHRPAAIELDDEIESSKASIDEKIEAYKAKGKTAPWFYSRISEETRKKNDRTKERNDALEEVQRLNEENETLRAQASTPQKSDGATPLQNVWTDNDFQQLKSECGRLLAWCAENPTGGEYVLGKDKEGNEITQFVEDAKGVTSLRMKADDILREGIPERKKFLEKRKEANGVAAEIYPDLRNPKSDLSLEATQLLRSLPALQAVPDIMIWLAHAITGRNLYLAKNGKGKTTKQSETASRIVKSVKTVVAPKMPATRGMVPRSGAHLDKAKKDLEEKGDAESAERYLEAKGFGQSKKIERIG